MKPLIVLVTVFLLSLGVSKIFYGDWKLLFAGNMAMSMMLLFTSIGHFAFPKGMSMMIPGPIPIKTTMVYVSGLIEIAAAAGLLIPSMRYITALLLIIFFIIILPANIMAL